jgi:phage-related protein
MGWVVEFLSRTVAAEVEALPNDMRAKFLRIVQMIESWGIERMREPHVKHLEGRLWEMRTIGRDGISRAIYVVGAGRRVVVVRAFIKKTQKTPTSELELARRRAKEVT